MKNLSIFLLFSLLQISIFAQNPCPGNILTNPDFQNQNISGWEGAGIYAENVPNGRFISVCTNGTAAYQTKPAVAGKTYNLGVRAFKSFAGTSGVVRLKFLSNTFQVLSENFAAVSNLNYTLISIQKIAPAGTAFVEVGLIKDAGAGCVNADDWCLTDGGGGNLPDLTAELLLKNGSNFQTGDNAEIKVTVRNIGTAAAVGGSDKFEFYFSSDPNWSADDVKLPAQATAATTFPVGFSEVWDAWNYTLAWAKPGGIPTGLQHILIVSDPQNMVAESNENNNVASVSLNISQKPSPSCTGDLLLNGGFDALHNGWSVGSFQPSAASLTGNGTSVSQAVAATAGSTYTMKAELNISSTGQWGTGTAILKIRFLSGSNAVLDSVKSTASINWAAQTFEISKIAPAGTTSAMVSVQRVNADAQTAVSVNFICLTKSGGGGGCATNLLQNPSFENNLTNWEGAGGTISATASAGTKSLKLCQNGSIRQTLATTPGKNLTLVFKARTETTGANKVLSYIKYLSSSFQPLLTEFFDFSTTADFADGTVSKTAPTGAVWVEIGFLKQTAGCVLIDEVCLSEGGNGLVDIAILGQPNNVPGGTVGGNLPLTFGLFNNSAPLTNVKITIPLVSGLAYQTTPFTATIGTFSTTTHEWTIPNLPVGTFNFTLNYVNQTAAAKAVFANLTNSTPPDTNPSNNSGVVQVGTATGGGNLPDLRLVGYNLTQNSVPVGGILNFKFDLHNSGTAAATGNFNIKSYLSTDAFLSANDIQNGNIPTGNLAAGQTVLAVMGALTVPQNTPPGDYFLLVKVDADDQITESDEINNLLIFGFSPGGLIQVTSPGGSNGADLKITLTADQTTVPQWGNVTYTLTARNEGNATISAATVQYLVCPGFGGVGFFTQSNGIVYAGTPAPPTIGNLNFVGQEWSLTNLAPGASGILTLKLFTTGTAEKKVVAFAKTQSPSDPDSQPNANLPSNCTPTQDDEAVWTINVGQTLLQAGNRKKSSDEFEPFHIFPNPAGASVFLKLPENETGVSISIFNQIGFLEKAFSFQKTENEVVELNLSEVRNGVYFLKIETAGQRAVVKKLVVSRMY